MKYFCIGDEAAVTGFKLAGVSGDIVLNASSALIAFNKRCADSSIAVIFICEDVARLIRLDINKFKETSTMPLILEIPSRNSVMDSQSSIMALVRHSLGVGNG